MEQVPPAVTIPAAGIASGITGIEALRSVGFEDLPSHLIEQLKRDGMRDGARRTLEEARELFEQRVNAEAKGSIEGIDAIVNDPTIEAMHIEAHANGGSADASNIVYGPEGLNSSIRTAR
jgi:hypothetical protein